MCTYTSDYHSDQPVPRAIYNGTVGPVGGLDVFKTGQQINGRIDSNCVNIRYNYNLLYEGPVALYNNPKKKTHVNWCFSASHATIWWTKPLTWLMFPAMCSMVMYGGA